MGFSCAGESQRKQALFRSLGQRRTARRMGGVEGDNLGLATRSQKVEKLPDTGYDIMSHDELRVSLSG